MSNADVPLLSAVEGGTSSEDGDGDDDEVSAASARGVSVALVASPALFGGAGLPSAVCAEDGGGGGGFCEPVWPFLDAYVLTADGGTARTAVRARKVGAKAAREAAASMMWRWLWCESNQSMRCRCLPPPGTFSRHACSVCAAKFYLVHAPLGRGGTSSQGHRIASHRLSCT